MKLFAWFDTLRCVAVLLVILAHCGNYAKAMSENVYAVFHAFQMMSWVGVDLFFVLSGFLVSGLLFGEHDRTGSIDTKRFLIRRGFKIIPPFYILIVVSMIYDTIHHDGAVAVHVIHDVFFLNSYRIGCWPHTWTLGVEVHFYILLALLLSWLSKSSAKGSDWLKKLPTILFWVLVVSLAARLINSGVRTTNFNVHREMEPSHLHLDVLAAGVLLRYFYNYHPEVLGIFNRAKFLWIGLALLLIYPAIYLWSPHPFWVTAILPTTNYLGFALILYQATQFPFPQAGWAYWLAKPLDYFGKHSYSIYLWHLPVKDWIVLPLVPQQGVIQLICLLLGSLAIGTLFSEIFELPILRLRNRLFPSLSSAKPVHAP